MSITRARAWLRIVGTIGVISLMMRINGTVALADSQVTLGRDRGLAVSYWPEWQVGAEVALRYQPSQAQFPFTPTAAQVDLHAYEGAGESATLMAVLYTASPLGPGLELAASAPLTVSFAMESDPTVTLFFDGDPPTLVRPQPLYLAVRYTAGSSLSVASPWFDAMTCVSQGECWYREGTGSWAEHHAFWFEPNEVGFPMLRLFGESLGLGTDNSSEVEAEADTMLVERIPDLEQGDQTYLQVGSDGIWGDIVSLVRFPFPNPPVSGAVPLGAELILYHYQVASETAHTQPISVTARMVSVQWEEASANWESMAEGWDAMDLAQTTIPGYDAVSEPRDYFICWDVTEAALGWWAGEPMHGLALVSRGEPNEGLRHLGSRERQLAWERPVMRVTWDLKIEDGINMLFVPHVSG